MTPPDHQGAVPKDRPITQADIRSKLQEIAGEVDTATSKVSGYREYLMMAGAVVAVGVVVIAFALGKRSGRKRRTVVEIRRITG
jgi:hypothetical protein